MRPRTHERDSPFPLANKRSGEPAALGPEDVEGVELEAKEARRTRFIAGLTL